MKELILTLSLWASAHTGLPMPEEPPIVQYLPQEQMHNMLFPEDPYDPESGVKIGGLYQNGLIYFPVGWKPDSLRTTSALLHELVHHLQAADGQRFDTVNCAADLERVAYETQFAWLKAAKVDPNEVSGVGPMLYLMVTNCDGME